jgi:hypothetical protein
MKILWIGPFIPSQYASEWPASSPAASKWQLCLLQGLFSKNINIELLLNRPRFTYFRKQFESKNINYEKNLIHGSYPCGGNGYSKCTN